MDLTILSISNRIPNEHDTMYPEFLASCRKYGFEPVITGDQPGEYGGLGSRPRLTKRAIERGMVPTKYMLFCDAWDVVFQDSPEMALRAFMEMRLKPCSYYKSADRIIWNAEKNCFPDAFRADLHPKSSTPWRYFNSGFAVGETEAFLEALKAMHADEICDDHTNIDGSRIEPCCQSHWMREFFCSPVPMALDTQCVMAQTLHMTQLDELDLEVLETTVGTDRIRTPKIRNKVTGTYPVAIHFNGDARGRPDLVNPILKHLGLR